MTMTETRDASRQRKREEARGIEEFRESLGTPAPLTPQAVFHWNCDDQVNALVAARFDDPDVGFMARLLALCSLPRTDPGNRDRYVRRNGPFTLIMIAGGEIPKLPYGTLPRLLLAWVCTEAVRTGRRELVLGQAQDKPSTAQELADLRASAEAGDTDTQVLLGTMYYIGDGVPQDFAEAVAWFRKAAEQGDAEALHNIGVSYSKGRGVPQDDIEAVAWYRRAAEQGLADAQFTIGDLYRDGRGVPQDDVEAVAGRR